MLSKKLFLASTVLIVLVTLLFIGSVGASSEMWSQTYGGPDIDYAEAMVETSDGGYALAGTTNSFGAGKHDFWLAKTDAQGIPEFPSWAILPLLFVASFAAIMCKQRLLRKSADINCLIRFSMCFRLYKRTDGSCCFLRSFNG